MGHAALAVTDKLWDGEMSVEQVHPVAIDSGLDEVAPGIAFITAFGNVTGVVAGGSLVLIDTGSQFLARANHDRMRAGPICRSRRPSTRTGTSTTSSGSGPTRRRRTLPGGPGPESSPTSWCRPGSIATGSPPATTP